MAAGNNQFDFDFIVIGSGFGGSVSAHRLVEKGYRVAVMEMGRRWTPDTLPRTSWSIHRYFWRPKLGLRGFFNMRFFRHVTIFHGCAVGGGSITYASTLLPPPEKVWGAGSWMGLADWKAEMPQYYETAARMLGVTENRILGPADHLLKKAAEAAGSGNTFYCTKVGIFQPAQGEPGNQTFPDPFFGGEGPARTTCTACGGCIMGCRYGAKNTLDLGYLYLAEKHGAQVFPETKVVNVKPLRGASDGSAGYEVSTVKSTAWIHRQPRRFTCRGVIFSASSLGTMELLFHLREKGSLPAISVQLGQHVRTNSESLIGARTPGYSQDLSQGIAIGSGVYIDEHTHIEAVRYPSGSDAMGLPDYDSDRWASRSAADCALAEKHYGLAAPSPVQDRACAATGGMGPGICDSALHAGAGRRDRNALATPLVLALPEVSREPRREGANVHSKGQRVREEIRATHRRFRDEHASGDPLRCSRHSTLHRRVRDRGLFVSRRG